MSTGGLRHRRRGGADDGEDAAPRPKLSFESFDLYQKVRDEEKVTSTSGGTVSLIAVVVCLVLIAAELYGFLVPSQREHMAVDPVVEDRLRLNFDITFHALPCAEANIDAMDVAGEQQNGVDHDIMKMRLAPDGSAIGSAFAHRIEEDAKAAKEKPSPLPANYCGTCYGADTRPGQCCNTCDDVRAAYAEKGWDVSAVTGTAEQCTREHRHVPAVESKPGEGCRLTGFMLVNKVAGNFHVAIGETHTRGSGHIHQFNPANLAKFNVTHTVHSLSFGEPYPGMRNPLDGTHRLVREGSGVFMYYLKVVPTVYDASGEIAAAFSLQAGQAGGSSSSASSASAHVAKAAVASRRGTIKTNQYSVTSQYRPAFVQGQRMNVIPGIFFVYDISPFMVTVTKHSTSLAQLLTSLFAILGGVLTLAKAIDAVVHWGLQRLGGKPLSAVLSGGGGAGRGAMGAFDLASALFSGSSGSRGGAGSGQGLAGSVPGAGLGAGSIPSPPPTHGAGSGPGAMGGGGYSAVSPPPSGAQLSPLPAYPQQQHQQAQQSYAYGGAPSGPAGYGQFSPPGGLT